MPDITMCADEKCPLRLTCWRFQARTDKWQSYFTKGPYNKRAKGCEYYTPVDKPKKRGDALCGKTE